MPSATSVPSSGTRMGRDKRLWALSFTSLSFPMAAPRLHPATSAVQHSLYPTQRRHPTACTSIEDAIDAARPDGSCQRPSRPYSAAREPRRAGSDTTWPGPGGWIEPGSRFPPGAQVGGGAIPGPAGTILLVLGILIALAVAAAVLSDADRWAEGAGTGESRRRSANIELPPATDFVGRPERPCRAPPATPKSQETQQATKENLSRPVASYPVRRVCLQDEGSAARDPARRR